MKDQDIELKKLHLKQNAIKLLINSIYGAFGNKWFYFHNVHIAQSITLQGQDLIMFSIKAVNHYFNNMWHVDTELHELLGISNYNISKIDEDAAIYTDTDSVYVQFNSAIQSIQGASFTQEEALQLCINIDKHRLSTYFDRCFEKYGKLFNTNNRQKFKLENLSVSGIWLKKKNYAIKVAYEPNEKFEAFSEKDRYLIIKGLEPIKSSYPLWARDNLYKIDKYIIESGGNIDLERDIIPKIIELRKEFETLTVDQIAFNFKIRVYHKYVECEKELTLLKGISIYPRAAAYYNHLLIKNDLLGTYNAIRENEKIKFYYCADNKHEFDVFAYSPENYPKEIAPPIDRDHQFFNLIVEPINRIMLAMKVGEVDITLKRAVEFIKPKSKKELTDEDLYPLYVINEETLEYCEVIEKFWKIIGNPDATILNEDFSEYLQIITKHGLNTVIVPKYELQKYIKKIERRKERLRLKELKALEEKNGVSAPLDSLDSGSTKR
jgi:hypothetical protein